MTGTALEKQTEQISDSKTPTVINVEARPITQSRPSQTAALIDRGLALLSSVLRLALLWVQNREEQAQRIASRQQPSKTPTSTPTVRRSTLTRDGGRRQRRRHRGRTDT